MIIARLVHQAKFGQGAALAAYLTESVPRWLAEAGFPSGEPGRWRILIDLASGSFDTVVLEGEAESLAHFEQQVAKVVATAAFQESMGGRMQELVTGGRTEFWTVVAEG